MPTYRSFPVLTAALVFASPPVAQAFADHSSAPMSPPSPDVIRAVAANIRHYLVGALPDPLYEKNPGWGHQERSPTGLKWTGGTLPLHPHVQHGERNAGNWKHLHLSAVDPEHGLTFELRDLRPLPGGGTAFTALIACPARAEYRHQRWNAGVKWYDASLRVRLRLRAALRCELTTRLEPGALLFPEVVIGLRVTKAEVAYDDLVVEHVIGVGGDAARVIGDSFLRLVHELKPSLERDLCARAEAAVVKGGRVREVRVSFLRLLGAPKALAPTPPTASASH